MGKLTLRYGPDQLELSDLIAFAEIQAAGMRLVTVGTPNAGVAQWDDCRIGLRVAAGGGREVIAASQRTFAAARQLATTAACDVVVLRGLAGQLHVFGFDELAAPNRRIQFVECAGTSGAKGAVAVDTTTPPSRLTLLHRVADALGFARDASLKLMYRIVAERSPAVRIDDDDDVLTFVEDLACEGAQNVSLIVATADGATAATQQLPVAAVARPSTPPPPQRPDTSGAAAPPATPKPAAPKPSVDNSWDPSANRNDESLQQRFVSMRFQFNPPTMTIIGDLRDTARQVLEDAILAQCVGEARLAVYKTRPHFEELTAKNGGRYFEMRLPTLFFDENQQTQLLLCALDVMSSLRNWRVVPCDGEVHIEETILEHANREKAFALRGPSKPEKPILKFTQAFELLFVWIQGQ